MAARKGAEHHNSKLTAEAVADIRATYEPRKVTVKALAEKHGASESAVRAVIDGRTWKEA